MTILVLTLHYFQGKVITKSQKSPKSSFCAILGPFCPNLGNYLPPWQIVYHVKNIKKIIISHYWGKFQTDGRADREMDGRTKNGGFIGPSPGQIYNY